MDKEEVKRIRENLERELRVFAMDDKITPQSFEKISKLVDDITKCYKLEMYKDSEYSRRPMDDYSYGGRYYDIKGSYDSDMSYANRNRDRMGRFTSRDYSGARRYSREEAKDSLIDEINDLMHDATSEKERTALMRCKAMLQDV